MSVRFYVTVTNNLKESEDDIKCTNLDCAGIDGLKMEDVISYGKSKTYSSGNNDRAFMEWSGIDSGSVFQMAMTSPKSSHNSATGFGKSGLQHYSRTGTPVTFTFIIGEKDQADWESGDSYNGDVIAYGDCS